MVREMPADFAARHIARQLLRSSTSIGANLHEADMADTVKDFCHKVNISQKEAGETTYWLSLIRDAGILPEEEAWRGPCRGHRVAEGMPSDRDIHEKEGREGFAAI